MTISVIWDKLLISRAIRSSCEVPNLIPKWCPQSHIMQSTRLSTKATSNTHGEDSPYFAGWQEYDRNSYHPTENPSGVIQMGLAENQLSFDLLEGWLDEHPEATICSQEGTPTFRELALYQDYHGLPAFRNAMANFMEELRGNRVKFDPDRIVLTAGATAANEVLMFCLGEPGEAFLVPSPYYPGWGCFQYCRLTATSD